MRFYPKNQAKAYMLKATRVIFQFVNSFNFLLSLTSKLHRHKSTNPNVITNDFCTKLAVKSS